DEVHMVYQFSLPPLVLHALLTGNAAFLAQWAEDLEDPPPGCTFLNFTSSHDGIGVRPLQGLVPDGDLEELVEAVRQRGGEVSMKSNADGTESPYELNITYLSALTDPGETVPGPTSIDRFVCSQAIELAFKGIPAIYFNNLVGGLNNHEGAKETGRARTLNRGKWNWPDLNERLDDESSHQARIYRRLIHLLHVRAGEEAFHPESEQTIHRVSDKVLIIEREAVVCLNNVTDETVQLDAAFLKSGTYRDLISGRELEIQQQLSLKPYETLWLREQISP
ncbi:MAG: alpha-amylase, partial [Verrucomicrobiota bacterium]